MIIIKIKINTHKRGKFNVFFKNRSKQAGAELCQAQASYPIKVVTFGKLRAL